MQTLNNVTTVSTDAGQQTASASVGVASPVNPTIIPTGLTNNFFLDSFFLPMLLALALVWFYRQGFIGIPKWASFLQFANKEHRVSRQLEHKISQIKEKEVTKR